MKRWLCASLALIFYASLPPWAGADYFNQRAHDLTSDGGNISGFAQASVKGLHIDNASTGIGGGITFGTLGAPYSVRTSNTIFNGQRDDGMFWGYNLPENIFGGGNRPNTSEPQLNFDIESDFLDGLGGTHWMEYNMDYMGADGTTTSRPMRWGMNRATHEGFWGFRTGADLATLYMIDGDSSFGHEYHDGARVYIKAKTNDDSGKALNVVDNTAAVLLQVRNDGVVGIKKAPTLAELDVAGNAFFSNTYPFVGLIATGEAANGKKWQLIGVGATLQLRASNDAEDSSETVFNATRNGPTVTKVHIGGAGATSNVGIGPQATSPGARLEVDGGVRLKTADARPTCDAAQRMTIWGIQNGAGVADNVSICMKGTADTYSWVAIATAP